MSSASLLSIPVELSPFATTWLAIAAPTLLGSGVWFAVGLRARGVLRIGLLLAAVASLAGFGFEAREVLSGGLPWGDDTWRTHLSWTVLGGALWATSEHRRSPRVGPTSAALAGLYGLLGAWIPAVVMVGLDRARALGGGQRIALGVQAAMALLLSHRPFLVVSLVGGVGLSVDGTTILAAWVEGCVDAGLWLVVQMGLVRLQRPPGPAAQV